MTRYASLSEVEDLKARVEALETKQKPKTTTSSQINVKKEIKLKEE